MLGEGWPGDLLLSVYVQIRQNSSRTGKAEFFRVLHYLGLVKVRKTVLGCHGELCSWSLS